MRVASAVLDALPSLPERITPADWADITAVLDGAIDWAEGFMDLGAFAKLGAIPDPGGNPSSGYSRHVALRVTPRTDERWDALRRAIDHLLLLQGVQLTNHGAFDADELIRTGTTLRGR